MDYLTSRCKLSIKIDQLSSICLLLLLCIAIVHIYSEDMSHDPHQPRFMSYLSLFTFAMLVLVTPDNFHVVFV